MITRQVEHPYAMAMALVGALRTFSSNTPPERSRGSMEITLEVEPAHAMFGHEGATPLAHKVRFGLQRHKGTNTESR